MRLNYLIEGALIGTYMIAVAVVGVLMQHAGIFVDRMWDPTVKRFAGGCLIALATIALEYSPLGRRSGAHMNPALSIAFFYLKKLRWPDLVGYVTAQFIGAAVGISVAALLWSSTLGTPSVRYGATIPGHTGALVALIGEAIISFLLMTIVLRSTNLMRIAPFTGIFVGMLSVVSNTFESPFSGSSSNPARTFASTLFAMTWQTYWIYVLGPVLGMLSAALVFQITGGRARCARIVHDEQPCTFPDCQFGMDSP
jgi:aquaporin Z